MAALPHVQYTPFERLAGCLDNVTRCGAGFTARCPSHDDRHNSLSVGIGADGKALVWCHAGCPLDVILDALGMTAADLFVATGPAPGLSGNGRAPEVNVHRSVGLGPVVATYPYSDWFQVTRHEPKTFRPWHRERGGAWRMGAGDVEPPLYQEAELLASDPDEPVYIVEGEKDADLLRGLGCLATTNAGGAGKWHARYAASLQGRKAVILPDHDEAGRKHGEQVAVALSGVAAEVKIVRLPGLPEKGDASDYIVAGGTKEDVDRLAAMAPAWMPPAADATASAGPAASAPTLHPDALLGLAGDVVRAIDPHTEGDPVAILSNYLVMAGSAIGAAPYVAVGGARHGVNAFAVQVGDSAKSRKGTAYTDTLAIVRQADATWAGTRLTGGLSSGEGLIYPIRDAVETVKKGETSIADPGEPDKRLLAVEEEFSAVLKVATREGNTLTEQLRRAWDGRTLGVMTRNSPLRASGPHVSILAHITKAELLRVFDSTDAANGFGNRFLWLCVRRSKVLPEGGRLPDTVAAGLVRRTAQVLAEARKRGEVKRDDAARALWAEVYPDLSDGKPGLLGALTARAEAQVLRLSLLYALLDDAPAIGTAHLLAALALWDYAEASARYIFGDATGDPIADRIIAALRANGPMAQSEIVDLFGRNVGAARLGRALESLAGSRLIRSAREETGGRPRLVWEAVEL